jgi:hypothetical protein
LVEKTELLDAVNGTIRILPMRPALLLLLELTLLLLLDGASGSRCTVVAISCFSGVAFGR